MPRIFSGIQPSGELHVGNYLGAVKNWVELQKQFETYICIVNYHAITVVYEPADLRRRTHDMAVSLLAAGIDPSRATLFVQSTVSEHTELAWIFNSVTPLGELERQTQFKEKAAKQESVLAGLLNYPVLQAADILLYKADSVPVGEDQVQHLELSREVARRWNAKFTPDAPYFPEPKPLLTKTARVMGLDGQAKMSKSLNNYIGLLEEPDSIWEKLRPAMTDPARKRKTDPGNPDICNIYTLHKAFSPRDIQDEAATKCRSAGWGCIDCKKALLEPMVAELTPIRRRARELSDDPAQVEAILAKGTERAHAVAKTTLAETKQMMGLV
ncbi:MAG TPA: tryptophan--tRNA ligase [Gemmatimonadaceae bacterium]|nr:tryptophan--tRNA ligase [Gemmatimonadaceae bacterium]